MTSDDEARCRDCNRTWTEAKGLNIVAADFGEGAFLAVLCEQCEHRRWYRGDLKARLQRRVRPSPWRRR